MTEAIDQGNIIDMHLADINFALRVTHDDLPVPILGKVYAEKIRIVFSFPNSSCILTSASFPSGFFNNARISERLVENKLY